MKRVHFVYIVYCCCCCCRPHSTNVLPAESSTRNHVAASSLSPQVASVHRLFFYSFTASDGSEEFTAGRVVSPCSITMHHGFRSNEVRRERKQKYRIRQTTSHSSLLVARQGDASRKLNQAFLLVDSFNFNFVDKER